MAKNNEGSSMLGSLRAPSLGTDFNRNVDRQRLLSASEELANAQNKMRANEAAIAALTSRNQELADSRTSGNLDFVSKLLGSDKNIIARNNEEIARLQSEIQRIGSEIQGITPESLAAQRTPKDPSFAGEYARNVAGLVTGKSFANAFADPSGSLSDLSRANEGGAITSTALAALSGKAPGPQAFMNSARLGRNFLRAGKATSSFSQALEDARVATEVEKTLGAQARSSTKQVASKLPQPSSLVGKLSKGERISGAAQKASARAGMTATNQELSAAAPFIDAAGGDFEAGMSAYKASLKGGKNVGIPSPAASSPSAPLPSSSEAAQSAHVPPREASAASPAPAPASPSSSTLSKLLKSAGLVGTGATAGFGLANLLGGAKDAVAAEEAQVTPEMLMQRMPQVQNTISQANAVPEAQQTQPTQEVQGGITDAQLLELIMGGQQGAGQATPSGPQPLISDTDIAQIQKLMGAMNPQQPEVTQPEKKPSVGMNLLNALAKGLIAGGTGDPNAAFAYERNAQQEALAQEQLRRSRQELNPQQSFANQLLAQVLGNRMSVSGQKEVNTQQIQASQQAQAKQLAAQVLLLNREQQNAMARGDKTYAQQLEMQKREFAARLEQIKAQTTGQLQFMLNPEIQRMLSGAISGGNAMPQVNY